MQSEQYSSLKSNVNMLGQILGQTMKEAVSQEFLDKVEEIRLLSKSARQGSFSDGEKLRHALKSLQPHELLPVARAFSQFLNLANIADQNYTISREMDDVFSATKTLTNVFDELLRSGSDPKSVVAAVKNLKIELVLTAHPTEVTRRTLIHKHGEIDSCLSQLSLQGITARERAVVEERLRELIAQIWHTYDFRRTRPSPVDEAKWGYAVVENSLWDAVPEFIRRLDRTLFESTGVQLPIDISPVQFASWMGGDRDGNPNVTASVTEEVLLLSRWQATSLYLVNIEELIEELSMSAASQALTKLAAGAQEPYRVVLRQLRDSLRKTLRTITTKLEGQSVIDSDMLSDESQLWEPLFACYQSLVDSGLSRIANGKLRDLLRRVKCFGVHLVKIDVRQDSDRHTEALSELTQYLQLGDYREWGEQEKQQFLLAELNNPRPLIPTDWQPSSDVQEVLDTFAVVASQSSSAIGCYIISMARQASDILAVKLLLKASGCTYLLPVVPLFETLDDLNRAASVVDKLLAIPSYKAQLDGKMMVMIGYSDSAKDAGMLAASWAQYRAQEALIYSCQSAGIDLTLFHGRGGSIGRGGVPAHAALLSQPPSSLAHGLRVTEQGEMIRTKLGLKGLATKTLALYTSAILKANLQAPPKPTDAWRDVMDQLSAISCEHYRSYVKENEDFVRYFREATPEQELAKLPLGSRPARRKTGGGIASLRAIPWIFAWTQNRLMLPAWLGAGTAISELVSRGELETLKLMARQWPFFQSRLSMLEMVFAKADKDLSAHYDEKLASRENVKIGEQLRAQLSSDAEILLTLLEQEHMLQKEPWSAQSIQLRNIYTDPLNYLQVELLDRNRECPDEQTEQAIMVTIAGIAAGMRNTG